MDAACEAAEGDDVSAILDGIYDFTTPMTGLCAPTTLADYPHYCADSTRDTYWGDEYNHDPERPRWTPPIQELFSGVAQSPRPGETEEEYFGEGFFDKQEDEETVWDETHRHVGVSEARLQTRYYELSAQAADYQDDTQGWLHDACADGMSLLAELTSSGRR